ncbi:ATP-grasp domain-containing protein [Bacillus sp. CH30_1T]|uniref:ATP-grasp domain-containing protein n=1 Tax=Bacillus sp. CH30_1T TaxID=2604836 RepID=UPI0011EF769E|nr:ATP-grasp domain-containing protein [Bacillus sp. CH30_1T]KAA0563500.1 ATP-grasp domain-containing protein [Bacillus sp. CH30_1T]
MLIGILGWDLEEFESVQLEKASKEMGHDTLLFSLQDIEMSISASHKTIHVFGKDLKEFDVIISRAQLRKEHYQEDLQILFSLNEYVDCLIDHYPSFTLSESKLLTYQKLSVHGFTVPDTFLCTDVESIRQIFDQYSQIVIKPSFGYAGQDVERIDGSFEQNVKLIETLLHKYGSVLVQEFIPHPDGDIRVTTLGNEAIVCFNRLPNDQTWKANVGMGASIERITPPQEVVDLGIEAAKCVGLQISGVDIVRSKGKYYIFEVNNCPGWYPLKGDGEEVAREIIRYCVSKLNQKELVL